MADIPVSLKAITIPVSMVASILGGSAYLTSTRSDLDHLVDKVKNHRMDFKETRATTRDKIKMLSQFEHAQDKRLSRMEGKQDLILQTVRNLEKRFEKR